MNPVSNTATPSGCCCGMCRKKIRMRDEINLVLCTAILDVVAVDKEVCEKYEENTDQTEESYSKGF